jgi:hypothetical protein
VGKAHWVVLPYCTQDFHSGRRTQPRTYDFTGVRSLVRDVEARVRGGTTPAALERAYPGMDVEGGPGAGGFTVTRLTITIEQRGALNVEAALPAITFALAFEGVDLARADVTIAGSSAGGFGSWYNARLFGDRLYPHRADTDAGGARLARLTIVPMSGSPAERVWSDAANGLVTSPDQVASLDHRLDHHSVARPCSLAGGAYTPTPGAHCDDTLDLIRHYLRRWAGLDLRIAPVINKEDPLGLRGFAGQPGQPGYAAGLVRFCKTVHRLSQEAARTGSQVHPWTAWMWDNKPTPSSPLVIGQVHGFEFATGLVPQLDPEEPGTWHPSLLEWVNAVAARDPRLASTRSQIERRSGLVRNAFDPGTTMMPFDPPDGISPYQRAACNVPPPGS